MEKIAYVLGAGFSAFAGLPVMSNFLERAKDMHFFDPSGRYAHFREVIERIQRLSVVKNYFKADLFNIEEILSILEMRSSLGDAAEKDTFIKFIADVIRHYSASFYAPIKNSYPNAANWHAHMFGPNEAVSLYGFFALSIAGKLMTPYRDQTTEEPRLKMQASNNSPYAYSIVTLNYDRVIEKPLELMADAYKMPEPISFDNSSFDPDWKSAAIAKLHGDVEQMNIIPPTWSKSISPSIAGSWRMAFGALSSCNHIRIIGYSLPITDSYIKYLFKAAIIENSHLKTIDVICLDQDGSVRARYDDFVDESFRGHYRFKNQPVQDYLRKLHERYLYSALTSPLVYDQLEAVHAPFML